MMPKDVIRFAVADDTTGFHSASWRIWQEKKGDVYLSLRAGGNQHKISLHVSRKCRYAESHESAGGPRKAHIAWTRPETPSAGLAYVICVVFPTSYLGKSREPLPSEILRISPAPLGNATAVQVFFTRDSPQLVTQNMGTTVRLLCEIPTPSGEFCGIACFNISDWQDVDIIAPASHHEGRELRFTAVLPEGMERTLSLMLPRIPDIEGAPLVLVERYGYAVAPGTPCVQLTEPHGTLSRSEHTKVWRPKA